MSLPPPLAGQVIRYAYLWDHEAAAGQQEGVKERPCAIVVAVRRLAGETIVVVAPITHSPPTDPADALELPADTCRQLGLDDERQWLRCDQVNLFAWPGHDLSAIPGRPGFDWLYGQLPRALYMALKERIAKNAAERRLRQADRR